MATFYIGPSGDDANDGSYATPWRNLWYAVAQSGATDTIIVKQGVTVCNSSHMGNVINLNFRQIIGETGYPADCVIDGNQLAIWQDAAGDEGSAIQGITFKNSRTSRNRNYFFMDYSGVVEDCIFEKITVRGDPNDVQGASGIAFGDTTFRRCVIKDIACYASRFTNFFGVRPNLQAPHMRVENCVIVDSGNPPPNSRGSSAFVFVRQANNPAGSYYRLDFVNTIVLDEAGWANGMYGVFDNPIADSDVTFDHCCYFGSAFQDPGAVGLTITDTINANPLFVDAPNGDYRLRPGSPCIGSGKL